MRKLLIMAIACSAWQASAGERVLAVGGAVTEIVYALGAEDDLVARDTTSTFPAEAEDLPDVGYMRALSPEGVLSVSPDLILAVEGAGPPETLDVLKSADIDLVTVPDGYDSQAVMEKVRVVGEALGREDAAKSLAQTIQSEFSEAEEKAAEKAGDAPKRVMFVLSTQGGRIMASGYGTAADAMIDLAGGENALSAFEGYKPLSDEAVIAAAPDAILVMDRGGAHGQSNAELLALPAIAATPAGRSGTVIRMSGLYLLGFGPRTASAVSDLSDHLYGS
ncbi:MAG: ABC transporter substrate-binding protein [Pseudomonadota bacterium]